MSASWRPGCVTLPWSTTHTSTLGVQATAHLRCVTNPPILRTSQRAHHSAHITAGRLDMTVARSVSRTKQARAKAATRTPRPSGSANSGRLGHRGSPARRSPRQREDQAHQLSCATGPGRGCEARSRRHLNQPDRRFSSRHARPARPGCGILPPHCRTARRRPRS